MQLDADLRRLEAIALAGLLTDTRERMWHQALRTDLLRLRQVVLDLDPRKVLRDRFASAGMRALVRADFRGALTLGLLGGFDRGQDLGLVEQHRLIRVDRGSIGLLGGGAEVLRLHPAQFLLQQNHSLAVMRPFGL